MRLAHAKLSLRQSGSDRIVGDNRGGGGGKYIPLRALAMVGGEGLEPPTLSV